MHYIYMLNNNMKDDIFIYILQMMELLFRDHRHPSTQWQSQHLKLYFIYYFIYFATIFPHHLSFTTTVKGRYGRWYFHLADEKTKFQIV